MPHFPPWHATCISKTQPHRTAMPLFCTYNQNRRTNTMKRIKQTLLIAALTSLALGLTQGQAQDNTNSDNNNNGGRRRFGGDPAQFQHQMLERTRERLEVKDD